MFESRTIVGFYEDIILLNNNGSYVARIDSGATVGSIDVTLINGIQCEELGSKIVRSSSGVTKRKLVKLRIRIQNREVEGTFSVIDRSLMKYPILIGQDILKQNFLIDPLK